MELVAASPAQRARAEATGSIKHLPVNLFGAVMGLSGLALAWRLAQERYGAHPWIAEGIGGLAVAVFVVLAIAYGTKALRFPGAVASEFRHPVAGSFFGTIGISLLLLSSVIAPYEARLSQGIWSVGVIATLVLGYVVVSRLLSGRVEAQNAVPAWVIPGVATLDIPVTGAHMPMAWAAEVNMAAIALGTVVAALLYALIVSRLVHHEPMPKPMTPSKVILVAPFAVGFLAYVNLFGRVDAFAGVLFYFGLFIFLVVAPKVFRREVPFVPGWWAISFPMAALSNAAIRYAAAHPSWPLEAIAIGLLGMLTLVIAVLAARTLRIVLNGQLLRG